MKLKQSLLVLALPFIFSACSQEEPLNKETQGNNEPELFNLIVKFEGKTFDVPCILENDSLIYLDDNFNQIYSNQIYPNKDLATLVYKSVDGKDIVEYYHNAEELETEKGFNNYCQWKNAPTRNGISDPIGPTTIGRAILYDDKNYSDREIVLNIDAKNQLLIANLKAYAKFNDKTSSIRVFNFLQNEKLYAPFDNNQPFYGKELRTCLISFEDSEFNGKVLYCISGGFAGINTPESLSMYHQDWDLKKIGWNDKISSVVFRIVPVIDIKNGLVVGHDPIKK
jgi:lipoprotein